ncbi:MAG: BamA/TamA family outer membrane protein [Chitinophagaceae bacterium]|nr:BamA/TamA family outer membrane protein [Chitinophagaceae bacterium]
MSRFYLLGLLFLLNACADLKKAVIHDYPKQISFVYDNKVVIKDANNNIEALALANELSNYWDDSIKAKQVRQFGVFNTILQPLRYQEDKLEPSSQFMKNYLATKGYNQPILTPIVKVDTVKDEWRARITMEIRLNKKTLIDSVVYELNDNLLQSISNKNTAFAYVKKGMVYSNESINNELDRLVELFRANGYYYFTKEKIFTEVDTLNQQLMELNLDPLDQINQVLVAQKIEKEQPLWKLSFQLRNNNNNSNSNEFKQYTTGQQIFYTDLKLSDNPDTVLAKGLTYQASYKNIIQHYTKYKFKSPLFEEQSIIKKGDLFNENLYYQTLNNFSNLGAWQQVDARTTIQNDSIYLHYFLTPSLRHSFNFDIEGSKNNSQLVAGNLLGLSTSITFRDRNVQKKSISSISNARAGIELNVNNGNDNLTQTLLFNLGHTYSFPNLIIPFVPKRSTYTNQTRTTFSLNGAYIDRLNYYKLKSFTTNWGYELKKNKNGAENTWTYKPINVELYNLNKFAKLDSLLILNPFLRSSFNEGNVISQTFNYLSTGTSLKNSNQNNYLRIGIEEAGGLTGLFNGASSSIYRYIKAEVELRKLYKYQYTELAWRFMGGWGNNYSNDPILKGQLPFFKQFTAGGPYSMRAWGLRQLGLGSSQFYDTSLKSQSFDRFGDFQLEANLEYRFPLFQWGSYKIGSAVFTDIGNIWNIRGTELDPAAGFKLDKLYKDIAVAVGTGLRMDFNYFIIRIDYALKMKDPTRLQNDGWLDIQNLKWAEVKPNGVKVNNYALQFGIGLPF